jgi:flagellar motor switch protein FliM
MEAANENQSSESGGAETQPRVEERPEAVRNEAAPSAAKGHKRFDFRHPTFLSSSEWRKLRMELDEFVESVAAVLSTYLRLDFTMQLSRLDTVTFSEFVGALPPATHLTMVKFEPLRGISLLEVRPNIGFGIVDRLLGGPGKPVTLERNLTEMEVALMDQFVQIILDEWCKQWLKYQELRAEILGHENNPKFLQSSSGDTILLAATLETRMGECLGQLQLAFPYSSLEPVIKKLTQATPMPAAPPATPVAQAASASRTSALLNDIPLTFMARWPVFKTTTRELIDLKVGEILELKPEGAEKIELCIGNQVKFRGRLGARQNKRAVQITEICKL